MDTYLSKLRGLAAAATSGLPGKVGRDYACALGNSTAHSGLWTLYDATRHSTGQAATVWVFDKRYFDQGMNRQLLDPAGRQRVLSQLTREATQLARLRHPALVQLIEPLEEGRQLLAFVTERVAASLDDLLEKRAELDALEIQEGLMQVARGLQFLHADARTVHGNLEPASVLIGARGEWKLGGLAFSDTAPEFGYAPPHTQPAMAYAAPERVEKQQQSAAGDVFALGCLAAAAHTGQSPIEAHADLAAYRRSVRQLGGSARVARLPAHLAPVVRQMLEPDPQRRLTLAQFQQSAYFDDVLAATLRYLAALLEQPAEQKAAFLRGLPRVLPKFPARALRRQVLPHLLGVLSDHALLQFSLPSVFAIVEQLAPDEVAELALPELRPVLASQQLQPQATAAVLDALPLLQRKLPGPAFRDAVLPAAYAALLSAAPQVQDRALQQLAATAAALGAADVRDQLLPRVQHVYAKASILSLKVGALTCLRAMLPLLDKQTVTGKVMPMLRRTKTRDPAVVMAMLDMYEEAGLRLDRQAVATEILPVLWAQALDDRLRMRQFERFMEVVRKLQDRIQAEHTRHLEQIQRADEQVDRFNQLAVGSHASLDSASTAAAAAADSDAFAAIVGAGSRANPPLANPLADLPPDSSASPASGWEWDAPVPAASGAAKSAAQNGSSRVSVDFMSTDGHSDTAGDDFGAFAAFPPPTRSSGVKPSVSNHKLGALNVNPSAKPSANRLGATRVGSAEPMRLQFGAIAPQQRQTAGKPGLSQKHAGGKAADLGDFDPFA